MQFDIPTLMAAGTLATAVAGLLTGVAWLADREAKVLLWWAAAYVLLAAGIAGLLVGGADRGAPTAIASVAVLAISPTLIWAGARVFGNRPPIIPAMAIGPLAYVVCVAAEPIVQQPNFCAVIGLGSTAAYLGLAVAELYRQRTETLKARWLLIAFLIMHTTIFLVGALEAALDLFPRTGQVAFGLIFGIIHFEQIIFVMGSAIFVVVMVRERSELRHKIAARIDTLTGLATRRAFLDRSEKLLLDCLQHDVPLALVICDLDHFKMINDTHGHAAGDLVLQMFAHIARGRLRIDDMMGRLGGEEFAIIMPDAGSEAAYAVAERIRLGFAEGRIAFEGETVSTTVSAGIATARHSSSVGRLLAEADAALYRAKALGRNRVEVADRVRQPANPGDIARVA
jgi:diguanylate cyclase (GGDEF)-like protein